MLPFKISVLVFLRNSEDELLLIERAKQPNRGCWSPIGGKLEMSAGESPFQTAIRETREETGLEVSERDLHLFCMISEKGYEASTHWLMFLFDCLKPLDTLPPSIEEGRFRFFPETEIENLPVPETDRQLLWPIYRKEREGFSVMRANCYQEMPKEVVVEQRLKGQRLKAEKI